MKKVLTIALAALLMLSLLTGFASAESEVYKITVFNSESGAELNNDPIVQYLCEKFGLEFEWISPSWADNNSQMRMLIAGGETPDLMSSQITPGTADFQNLVDEEVILDLTDYLASAIIRTWPLMWNPIRPSISIRWKIAGMAVPASSTA